MNEYIIYKLKPMCDALLREPSVQNAKALCDELSQNTDRNSSISSAAQDVILLPLLMQVGHLSQTKIRNQYEIKVHIINSITQLLKRLKIRTLISFKTILLVLVKEIYVEDVRPVRPNLSEEFKLSAIECIETTNRLATSDVIEKFYVNENRNIIAQILSVCVEIIGTESYRKLRRAGINCILALVHIHDEADFTDVVLRDQIAGIVFILLPKIVVTLRNVALGDEKHGQTLITVAIKALGRILHLVMEDQIDGTECPSSKDIKLLVERFGQQQIMNDNEILSLKSKILAGKSKLDYIESMKRTTEWLQAASRKIQPVIENLQKLIGNKNKQVRVELAKFADCLLQHCSRNMSSCIAPLLQIVIAVEVDANTVISRNYSFNAEIIDMIDQIFLTHLIKMPRIICTGDEEDQTAGFSLLCSLLDVLTTTKRVDICLANANILNSLVSVLLTSVELQRPSQLLEEEHSIRVIDEELIDDRPLRNPTPWKEFKHLQNQSMSQKIQRTCQLLSINAEIRELVLDVLLKSFRSNSRNCNEILVLFQYLMPTSKTEVLSSSDLLILEEILGQTHWELTLQATTTTTTSLKTNEIGDSQWYEDRTEGLYESAVSIRTTDIRWSSFIENQSHDDDIITLNDVKFNALHTCLIIETVAAYATYLGAGYAPFLLNSLHRLLEKAGSRHFMIHTAGLYALNKLKMALSLDSLSELIFQNVDYITFHLNQSIRNINKSQGGLDIFGVVLKYTTLDYMPHVEGILSTVLDESVKSYQTKNTLSFLKLFRIILVGIQSLTKQEEKDNTLQPKVLEPRLNHKDWLNSLLEKDDLEQEVDVDENIEPTDTIENESNVDDTQSNADNAIEKPKFIEITLSIMKRCIRYVASTNRDEKLVALDTIYVGIEIIKMYENDLLPMVHAIWQPFAELIRNTDPIILRRCFSLLLILATYAKDFIYQRSSKEILPFIIKFLKENPKSTGQRGQSYELSQEYKLLRELLLSLPKILKSLGVGEKDLNNILDATVKLLSNQQRQTIQQHCVQFFIGLAEYDRPAVLLKLLKLKEEIHFKANVSKVLLTF